MKYFYLHLKHLHLALSSLLKTWETSSPSTTRIMTPKKRRPWQGIDPPEREWGFFRPRARSAIHKRPRSSGNPTRRMTMKHPKKNIELALLHELKIVELVFYSDGNMGLFPDLNSILFKEVSERLTHNLTLWTIHAFVDESIHLVEVSIA